MPYARNKGNGFVILDFLSNQFDGQFPGAEAETGAFCSREYSVTFPQFNKIDVNGQGKSPCSGI